MGPRTEQLLEEGVLHELLVQRVSPPCIWHDVRNTGFRRCFDEFALRSGGCHHGQCDDENLLSPHCVDQRCLIVIVYNDGSNALGQLVGAVRASDGSHGVLPSFDQLLSNESAQIASSLDCNLSVE
jgi:hypothetical protein